MVEILKFILISWNKIKRFHFPNLTWEFLPISLQIIYNFACFYFCFQVGNHGIKQTWRNFEEKKKRTEDALRTIIDLKKDYVVFTLFIY